MDDKTPRRRELTTKEQKYLEKQRKNRQRINQRKEKAQAKKREKERQAATDDANIVLEIPPKPPKKRWKKTVSDVIAQETDKRVRDLDATDHKDGYYADEVAVRKAQAEKQRSKRRAALPKQLTPKQRRRRRIITYVSIIAGVLIVGVTLSLTVLFKAEKIVVKGNKYYNDAQIVRYAGVKEGDNIFMTTMFGNAGGVTEHLPYIKSAKFSFEIPNTIVITVENESPYYLLKSDGKYFLVSEKNRILERVESRTDNIMFVNAPSLKDATVGAYVEFSKDRYTVTMKRITESLVNNGYSGITSINITDLTDIRIIYDNRIEIRLGNSSDLDYKIRTAFTIINTKLDPNNSGKITGVLNVSECRETKKSYFNPEGFKGDEETVAPTTEPATKATKPTETETETETEEEAAAFEGNDTDGDGIIDDYDGDGIPDYYTEEEPEGYDSDGDGIIDDYDGDGVPDDLDGDGIPDDEEGGYSWEEGAYDGNYDENYGNYDENYDADGGEYSNE